MNPAQALQAKILGIFASIIAGVATWKAPTNLGNIVADIGTAFGVIKAIDPNALEAALLKEVSNVPAEYAAVSTGSVAILGGAPVQYDGEEDEIEFFAVRKYKSSAPPPGSQAEQLKTLFGT